ncbi:hypothetical protein ACFV90_36865 [Streptomyces sp. NPDC059904]|uniref:hypothetical protein n=1 Tax=Streptomyces sp. NPDC059904 TaxID=3346996 RepID=UPI00365E2EFA
MYDDVTAPACIICSRGFYADELGRYSCRLCQERGVTMLRAMPALYAQLGDHLQPGANRGEGRVSGSKSAPMPCSADVLDLRARGGLVTILASWEDAVRDELGYTAATFRGTFEQTLAGVVGFLIGNAPWIYCSFAAVDELHDELRRYHGQARRLIDGERPPRRMHVTCPCGQRLGFTLDTRGLRCPNCQQQHGHSDLLDLPLAERSTAA